MMKVAILSLALLIALASTYTPPERGHFLYKVIPHRSEIRWYDGGRWILWTLFGNDDNGLFGEKNAHFHPEEAPSLAKAITWIWRNPFHNFTFYVIGSAHEQNSAFVLLQATSNGITGLHYFPQATANFIGEKGSSLYLVLHGGKPFISCRLDLGNGYRGLFYLGWRCRGNFGIKLVAQKPPIGYDPHYDKPRSINPI